MSASTVGLAATFTAFIATLTGHAVEELPAPEESGAEWRDVLDLWLARYDFGRVPVANPYTLSWAGHWIGIVDSPEERQTRLPSSSSGRHPQALRARPCLP